MIAWYVNDNKGLQKERYSVLVSNWSNYYFYSMTKKTYNIITGVLVGVIVGFGNYFGYSPLERIVALIIVGVSFELLYRYKLKKWKNYYCTFFKHLSVKRY